MSEAAKGHLAMLAFSALIAGSFALGSMAAPHVAPTVLNAVRFVAAAVILGIVRAFRGGHSALCLCRALAVSAVGRFDGAVFRLDVRGAEDRSAGFGGGCLLPWTPVMSGVFGFVLLRQVMTGRMALALAVGAAGALWVIFDADWNAMAAFELGRGETIYLWGYARRMRFIPPWCAG